MKSVQHKKTLVPSSRLQYCVIDSPVGKILLAGNRQGLRLVSFQDGTHPVPPQPGWSFDEKPFRTAIRQLAEYFEGRRKKFSIKLSPEGTPFQHRVWQRLRSVPYGRTASYGEIATAVGQPKASRAVGAANGRNPLSIVVPCHRIIGRTGQLVGYGGGLGIKGTLLSLERRYDSGKH